MTLNRVAVLIYGLIAYVMFLGVFAYLVGFLSNLVVPKSIDSGEGLAMPAAVLVNLGLLSLFGLQHTVMARPTFKKWWTRFVPAPIERSTYVMFTNVVLVLLYLLWQPMPAAVWSISSPVGQAIMWSLFAAGWALVFISTCLLNHFDLFGLRQVWLHFTGRPYAYLKFNTPLFYRWVRHPLYVGWLLTFWATPAMSAGHLLFAAAWTAYILIAIQFEERNLVQHFGERYVEYRRRAGMLWPVFRGKNARREDVAVARK